MNLNVKTRYDIGETVIVNNEILGFVVGLRIDISQPSDDPAIKVLIADKSYMVNVKDDVIEVEEELLKKYKKRIG